MQIHPDVWLSGCLVERRNFAFDRLTWRSSVESDRGLSASYHAVDGNLDSNLNNGSCFNSDGSDNENPWWIVELEKPIQVEYVLLTNRGDCCGESSL